MISALLVITLLAAAFVLWFVVLGEMSKSGHAAGLVDGHLSRCPDTPNCVCSEYQNDGAHFIEPLAIPPNSSVNLMPFMRSIIVEMGGTVQTEKGDYMAATFSSAIFGFVDDLEIRIDRNQMLIHVRSASRVGRGDLGVNKKRTELLRKLYLKKFRKEIQGS